MFLFDGQGKAGYHENDPVCCHSDTAVEISLHIAKIPGKAVVGNDAHADLVGDDDEIAGQGCKSIGDDAEKYCYVFVTK